MENLQKYIDKLNALNFKEMYNGDFFLTWEKTDDEIEAVFTIADALRYMREHNISTKVFESGLGISLFRDNSTRTRFSFASACNLLGLEVQDLDEGKSQVAHGETVRETANMISFMADVIGIRDDMYIGKGNAYMHEVVDAVTQGDMDGINALEKELLAQNAEHKDWACTEELMKTTKDGKALYLHCLPADITGVSCETGEVDASVFDRYRTPLYKEASYKPYIIAAMILLAKFEDPAKLLKKLEERGINRVFE